MSSVIAAPDLIAAAATDLAAIGSTVSAAHMTAAAPTVAVIPAAADEVSAGIAHVFSVYAQDYHGLAGQAAAFHEQFVQHLTASAGSYASTEAANAAVLQASNANAGSFVGAIVGTFLDQLVNLVGAVLGELVNLFNSFVSILFGLITLPLAIAGQLIGFAEQVLLFPISLLLLLFGP
jgi:PE family